MAEQDERTVFEIEISYAREQLGVDNPRARWRASYHHTVWTPGSRVHPNLRPLCGSSPSPTLPPLLTGLPTSPLAARASAPAGSMSHPNCAQMHRIDIDYAERCLTAAASLAAKAAQAGASSRFGLPPAEPPHGPQ